jgi:hypothetical protein
MRNFTVRPALVAIAVGLAAAASGPALAAGPPREARVVEGVGLVGLPVTNPDAVIARFGRLCVEGVCAWRVPGRAGGSVRYSYGDVRGVEYLSSTVPGWRTAAGVGPGSTVAALRQAYGARLRAVERCLANGFVNIESRQRGLALITRPGRTWRYTFFRTGDGPRVTEVVVGRTAYPPPPAGACLDDVPR